MTTVLERVDQRSEVDDDSLYEVVNGQRKVKAPMGIPQNLVCTALAFYLRFHIQKERLGTVALHSLFVLDDANGLQRRPDVAFVSRQRWRRPVQSDAWKVVPDVAVQVISPTDLAVELLIKIDEYFAAGVRLVWVVYCEPRKVYVYRSGMHIQVLTPQDTLDGDDVIPGFTLPVAKLFEDRDDAEPADS